MTATCFHSEEAQVSSSSETGKANITYGAWVFTMLPVSSRQCNMDFSINCAKRLGAKV